jgi:hypothetical protein
MHRISDDNFWIKIDGEKITFLRNSITFSKKGSGLEMIPDMIFNIEVVYF